jgi:glutaconate CoA-transferase subunit B
MPDYTPAEMMVVAAARQLCDGDVVFVGIGLPNLAINLAKRVHAPNIVMIYEAGVIGANPSHLPLSIGDPCLVTGAQSVCSMFEVFAFYLQSGRIDVGFLGGAQIDRFGNLNATVIGDYARPKVRLPGSGGSDEIATLARRIYVITPHQLRRFPAEVDFITSPGYVGGRQGRQRLGIPGGGPRLVITDLGLLDFDENGEMELTAIHPGVEVDQVKQNTGWDLKIRPDLAITLPPSQEELRIIREELDPQGIYLKGQA